jgi:hypothetical protein
VLGHYGVTNTERLKTICPEKDSGSAHGFYNAAQFAEGRDSGVVAFTNELDETYAKKPTRVVGASPKEKALASCVCHG